MQRNFIMEVILALCDEELFSIVKHHIVIIVALLQQDKTEVYSFPHAELES